MIIAEIGLNHLGEYKHAIRYVNELVTIVDAITFQVLEPSFYQNKKYSKCILSDNQYKKLIKQIHSKNKKAGIAISDINKIDFFTNIKIDFFKVLSKDIKNLKLLRKIKKTKLPVFISTGLSNISEIKTAVKIFQANENVSIIHTQLSHNISDVNLNAILQLKRKIKLPIAYGHHAENPLVLYLSLGFHPSDIFFYVKGNLKTTYPDHKHAITLSKVSRTVKNLIQLPDAFGSGIKQKMPDNINV